MKEFIQIDEAAKMLNVTTMTLRRWDNAGKLKAYRHPINKYRLYKKSDIENLTKKKEINIIEELDNIYVKLNAEMFEVSQFEKIKDKYKLICFYQKSYYKMLNLVRSFNLLFKNGFVDEAYILVRTMYEHNLNLLYVCNSEIMEEQIDKLNQWVANFKEWDEALKKKGKMKSTHWSGLNTHKLNEEVFKDLDMGLRNSLMNIWRQCCLVSHPNVITYEFKNDKGVCYVVAPKHALNHCVFIFIAFLQTLKYFLGKDFDKNTNYIKQEHLDNLQKIFDILIGEQND